MDNRQAIADELIGIHNLAISVSEIAEKVSYLHPEMAEHLCNLSDKIIASVSSVEDLTHEREMQDFNEARTQVGNILSALVSGRAD